MCGGVRWAVQMKSDKPSKRDIALTLKYYSSFAKDPEAAFKASGAREPRKRSVRTRSTDKKTETQLSSEIQKALWKHPEVAKVVRHNSGGFGERRQYQMNSAPGYSDLEVKRKDGISAYIEVKRDQKAIASFAQLKFLIMNWSTAYCGIARSIEDAFCIVEGRYTRAYLLSEIARTPLAPDYRYLTALFADVGDGTIVRRWGDE